MRKSPAEIIEEESARFLDTTFGSQLDLSGCPSCYTQPSNSDELPDERFAPLDNRGTGLGTAALHESIEAMINDPEVQDQVARETGSPELLANWQREQAERVAREFMRINPGYYRCPENWERLVLCLGYNFLGWNPDEADADESEDELIRRGFFTLSNLNATFKALSKAGSLETDPNQPRMLTEHDRRAIALQASSDVEAAIIKYLRRRLPEPAIADLEQLFIAEDVNDRLADPALQQIVDEAVYFCWEQSRADYTPTDERRQFMRDYVAGRIPTVRLLDQAWTECRAAERDALRTGILKQVGEPEERHGEPDLENLSDDEISQLYRGTLRKIAVDSQRGGEWNSRQ